MVRSGWYAVALALTASPVLADSPPVTDKLNTKIAAVTLADPAGKPVAVPAAGDQKATVVVFLSFDCPVSNGSVLTLADLHRQHSGAVAFVGVVPSDDPAEVAKQVKAFALPFPVVTDPKRAAADALKATTTPEAFVLDHNNMLRYRGRIDNAYAARLRKNATVTEHNLKDALEAVLAGKPVAVPSAKPVGCPIDTRDRKPSATAAVTYHKDVLPILQNHCQSCHRAGDVAPFALSNYKQAVNWADDIKTYTHDRKMPPWKPVAGVEFKNARNLSEKEIATLAAWADADCPEGNAVDAPPPAKLPDGGWRFGEPDLVLTPGDDFHVAASGHDIFRCMVLPTKLTEDKYIVAYEVKPGNPRVVHHALNYFDTTGKARQYEAKEATRAKKADELDRGPGYSAAMGLGFFPTPADTKPGLPPIGVFGGWAPGQLGTKFPGGAGFWLPKEADVVLQVHYHRTGKPEADRTKIGIYFAKTPPEKKWVSVNVSGMAPFSYIPPGKEDYKVTGTAWLTADVDLHSVMPHMHLIGRKVKITMTPPEGKAVTLIDIQDWDYNWQETYWLKESIRVAAGTRFDIEAVYDNSSKNPNNPSNPPKTVWFGEETTNEMLFGFFGATPVSSSDRPRLIRAPVPGATPKATEGKN